MNRKFREDYKSVKKKVSKAAKFQMPLNEIRKGALRAKEAAALRWVRAVNNHKGFGNWVLVVCKDPRSLSRKFQQLVESDEE